MRQNFDLRTMAEDMSQRMQNAALESVAKGQV